MKILVLIPVKPNMNVKLKNTTRRLAKAVTDVCGDLVEVVIDESGSGDSHITPPENKAESLARLQERTLHTSQVRNRLIRAYLKAAHTHVVWIDGDLVEYTPELPVELVVLSHNRNAVVAPAVYMEPFGALTFHQMCHANPPVDRWYDTAGFVRHGKWFEPYFPHYANQNKEHALVECEGVGCFYCVPASVYRTGAFYVPTEGFTEHLSICRAAKAQGMSSFVWMERRVYHAYLPLYDERSH